jgi:hypothetical protein
MDLLIEFGYGSHVILEVGLETQVLELHMFILPTHGSHALPPLDVKHYFKNTSKNHQDVWGLTS